LSCTKISPEVDTKYIHVNNTVNAIFTLAMDCHKLCFFSLQTTPPAYNISNMDVPVVMYHGSNDWLVVPGDVYQLESETKNLVSKKLIDGWEHLDFIWAMNAPSQCYNEIIESFKNYNANPYLDNTL